MKPDAVDGGHGELTGHDVPHQSQSRLDIPINLHDFPGRAQKCFPFGSNAEIAASPLNQGHMVAFLQRPDLLADSALGDSIAFRGLRKTRRFDDITENFESLDVHGVWEQKQTTISAANFIVERRSPLVCRRNYG